MYWGAIRIGTIYDSRNHFKLKGPNIAAKELGTHKSCGEIQRIHTLDPWDLEIPER